MALSFNWVVKIDYVCFLLLGSIAAPEGPRWKC